MVLRKADLAVARQNRQSLTHFGHSRANWSPERLGCVLLFRLEHGETNSVARHVPPSFDRAASRARNRNRRTLPQTKCKAPRDWPDAFTIGTERFGRDVQPGQVPLCASKSQTGFHDRISIHSADTPEQAHGEPIGWHERPGCCLNDRPPHVQVVGVVSLYCPRGRQLPYAHQ